MLHHEKKAFLKFFTIYFISIAVLILAVGFFYFEQMKGHYLKAEEFSMIEYARHIKMGESLDGFSKAFNNVDKQAQNKHIDIRNFTITDKEFIKFIPKNRNFSGYIKITKSKGSYDSILWELKKRIISVQTILLLIFAYLSYLLARDALKPLQESIKTLDKFAKDLIHDLNTPITSIKLNMKLLEKHDVLQGNTAIQRIKTSVHNISELHENLTLLLQEETFQMRDINICEIVDDVVQVHKQLYPNIHFRLECLNFAAKTNPNAVKQILQNIISNACKYNHRDGYVKIYVQHSALYIEDGGNGIKEPDKIFDRAYSSENSSGLGLDIAKRLGDAINMKIEVTSNMNGSTFILTMN